MRSMLMVFAAGLLFVGAAGAEYADYRYVPPSKSAEAAYPIPEAAVSAYLQLPYSTQELRIFEGYNAALEAKAVNEGKACQIAEGVELDLDGSAFFSAGYAEDGGYVFLGAITSVDAYALRVQVDSSALAEDEELWVLDAATKRPLGPAPAASGQWLPTLEGDTMILMLRSPRPALPALRITAVSHFFKSLAKSLEPGFTCPIHAACETDTAFQEVSTAVGMLIIPSGLGQVQCTASLLNNPNTAEYDPYMITANHCFSSGTFEATQIEVIWDYRAANCDGSNAPLLSEVPRSSGVEVLEMSSNLDGVLLTIDEAPIGIYGRAWLGWDTRDPVVGEAVFGIHHPQGTLLKLAEGKVEEINQVIVLNGLVYKETTVQWDNGITEQGSSGSPLLFGDGTYRVFGMLSAGTVHNCSTPLSNIDNYASFRHFFSQTSAYLTTTEPYVPSEETPFTCPAKAAFGADSLKVFQLRAFRDQFLSKSALGRRCIHAYYAAAPKLTPLITRSSMARGVFTAAAAPFARIGGSLVSEERR